MLYVKYYCIVSCSIVGPRWKSQSSTDLTVLTDSEAKLQCYSIKCRKIEERKMKASSLLALLI